MKTTLLGSNRMASLMRKIPKAQTVARELRMNLIKVVGRELLVLTVPYTESLKGGTAVQALMV
jgi:hypothetical protein